MNIHNFFITACLSCFFFKAEFLFAVQPSKDRDLNCITLLEIASDSSKKAGEMIKYEKLIKLKKSYLNKYEANYFSTNDVESKITEHNLKIKEKGKRYINKGLQKCGLK
tara:strand:+ start:259 stop:585 length:327 start_codon:yes stop_codon:yes gene_type:complete